MGTTSEQPSTTAASVNSPPQQPSAGMTEGAGRSITPVEMSTLPSSSSHPQQSAAPPISATAPQLSLPTDEPSLLSQEIAQAQSEEAAPVAQPSSPKHAPLERHETEAIGPSTDSPAIKPDVSNGPVIVITLLLTSGARHPYKLDEKYLTKRSVKVEDMDPLNISVYKLKELIWTDWRAEWETRPSSPSSIRLIHFGRMLDDKSPLKDCRFQQESPNVVHMTIKPQEIVDEEDAKMSKGGSRRDADEDTHAGCRCVIL